MDLLEQPLIVEYLEIPPDGHVRDAEDLDEVGYSNCSVLADPLEDQSLSLAREHLGEPPLRPSIPAFAPDGVLCVDVEIARQNPESQRFSTWFHTLTPKRAHTLLTPQGGALTIRLVLFDSDR